MPKIFKNTAEVIYAITATQGDALVRWGSGEKLPTASTRSGPSRLRFPNSMLTKPLHAYMGSRDPEHWARKAVEYAEALDLEPLP